MATSKGYVTYIEDALRHVPKIRVKAMFGEYAVYCDDLVVGSVCDDTLFVKITDGTRALFHAETPTAPPYPGAKLAFVVAEDVLEDRDLMKQIMIVCRGDLAAKATKNKPKRKSNKRKEKDGATHD